MGTRLRQTKLAFGRMESWKGNGAEASSLQKRERVKVGRLEGWKVGRLEGNGAEASSLHKRERGKVGKDKYDDMNERNVIIDSVDPQIFYGVNNNNVNLIRNLFPKLRMAARGNVLRV
ncbi:MAG: hypothetical protein J1E95_12080, partial [Muribaculaceae bacterium]|nr:hypothetical protein [Muribaculaceae bacterium]